MTSPGGAGFKIADGYVEVHGVVDRRSVVAAADAVTRGVSDQMTTGVAFANLRDGGRKMGAVLGEHGGPSAAREVTEGLTQWIDQGAGAGNVQNAGTKLGQLLGRSSGSPFVEHLLDEIVREVQTRNVAGSGGGVDGDTGTGTPGGGSSRDRDGGRDPGGRAGIGRGGGSGGDGSTGRGRSGPAGPSGKDADRHGRTLGTQMGMAAVGGFLDAFTGGFRGLGTMIAANPVVGTIAILLGTALAVAAAPAFAAAFAAALIGGAGLGLIGLGAFLLKDDPEVRKAASSLAETAKSVFKGGAQVLADPFIASMGILEDLLRKIGPDITEMFFAIAPAIVPLTRGFAGFVEQALPGFVDLIKVATPFLMDLENTLPRFGEHVGKFLSVIAEAGPGASQFFRDFLHLLGLALVFFGHFITTLTAMYSSTRTIILLIVDVFRFLGHQVKGSIDFMVGVFQRWYNVVKGIFLSARRESDGFVGFLKALPGKAWDALKPTPDRIKALFSKAGDWLRDAGSRIIGGLIRGIKDAIPGLSGVLDWVTDKIPDWKGPAERDRGLLEPTGEMIMGGLAKGIRKGADGVRADLAGLTSQIPAAVGVPAPVSAGPVTINIQGVWDFTDGRVPGNLVAALYRALDRYQKAYA
jgi:hypothetical protein